jgi:hypothetical protein
MQIVPTLFVGPLPLLVFHLVACVAPGGTLSKWLECNIHCQYSDAPCVVFTFDDIAQLLSLELCLAVRVALRRTLRNPSSLLPLMA